MIHGWVLYRLEPANHVMIPLFEPWYLISSPFPAEGGAKHGRLSPT